MNLAELNRRFVYTKDKEGDDWKLLSSPSGPLKGDCEDYALTALWIAAGCSKLRMWSWIVRGKAILWWCDTNKNNHMVLYVHGMGWIDNTKPSWEDGPNVKPTIPWVAPLFFLSMLLK